MKFLLLFVFVAVVVMIDARPSKSSVPSTKKNEEIKDTLKISNQVEGELKELERSKKYIHRRQYPGWGSSSVNVAEASASIHSNSGHYQYPHHRRPHYSTSHSESHGFAANVNLPHSSISVAQSEAHQHQQTFG
ncbi:uncharacterized protein LOC114876948 [Osmia bicornis bicornis]|uniref:uncharacterized protein LOC114876948 n=1 Tax=Osmia bicornis bicornis TaxID=1437191 RepID=UPI001EAE9EC2|nr:uncharacterized protein LOC114876948 [Osmia bicornis bicornis]